MSAADFQAFWHEGDGPRKQCLVLLHGTGGTEHDLVPLARALAPHASLLSPRGKVLEGNAPRFFRRFAEGILDVEDWRRRSLDLAAFIAKRCDAAGIPPDNRVALGFSNGANIAQGLLLLRPEVLGGAILIRPMLVSAGEPKLSLTGKRLLVLHGRYDPLSPPGDHGRLNSLFKELGATVESHQVEGGHGLTQRDVELAASWLAV
ncbi:MAG: alpha/beta hydrolase [Verrucomicrobiia bacterium]